MNKRDVKSNVSKLQFFNFRAQSIDHLCCLWSKSVVLSVCLQRFFTKLTFEWLTPIVNVMKKPNIGY